MSEATSRSAQGDASRSEATVGAQSTRSNESSFPAPDRSASWKSEGGSSVDTNVFDDNEEEDDPEWTESAMIEKIKNQLEKKARERNDTRLNAATNTMTNIWSNDNSMAVRNGTAKRSKPTRRTKMPSASSAALGDLAEE
ncbi:hypothetical protein JCM24511_06017 [Saitozyma sp. JCM 24511]|nr:hypothetical protein JCM24511_06017 [Saitozyma sp. JCM 24511]